MPYYALYGPSPSLCQFFSRIFVFTRRTSRNARATWVESVRHFVDYVDFWIVDFYLPIRKETARTGIRQRGDPPLFVRTAFAQ